MQEYFLTMKDYMKLEKVEFGGTHGQCYSDMVACLFRDFQDLSSRISNCSYNALDLKSQVSVCKSIVIIV